GVAAIVYWHRDLGLFLLRVVGHDASFLSRELHANAAILLIGKNGSAGEGLLQLLPVAHQNLVATAWQHPVIVRELPVHQLGRENHIPGPSLDMTASKGEADLSLIRRQEP